MIPEEAVRLAVLAKARKFWSSKKVDKMTLSNFEPDDCNHYMMESFREARKTKKVTEPFSSSAQTRHQNNLQALAQLPPNQEPPNLWSVIVQPEEDFVKDKKKCEVPGSSSVCQCSNCYGWGKVKCCKCNGSGFEKCTFCSGSGCRTNRIECTSCKGKGSRNCVHCLRTGKITCGTCAGHGSVRKYSLLKVYFDSKRSDYYTSHDGVPPKKLEKVTGTVKFSDCRAIIVPFEDHPCNQINEASQKFWQEHNAPDDSIPLPFRMLKHRHFIEIVPIVKGKIKLSDKTYDFAVFGKELVCHIAKKPSRCSIL